MDLIFSDIHADISALNTIINLATSTQFTKKYGKFSRVINLGDLLERGTNPKQVLEKMKELSENYAMLSVMGNHDESFIYGKNLEGSSLESISMHRALQEKELEFFTKNSDGTSGIQEKIDKKNGLVCVHGGPLDPKKIIPENPENEWLYQKTWQRLSDDDEFFSNYGYHYSASSAFSETKTKTKNPIILCGHQHMETALAHNKDGVQDILSKTKVQTEKMESHIIEKREISIESDTSYLVRLGLGGPQGHYGTGEAMPHFGIIQDDQKKITLFGIRE